MKPLNLFLLSLFLIPAFPSMRGQDVTTPVIPAPPPAQTAAPIQPQAPQTGQVQTPPPAGGLATPPQPAAGLSADYVIGPMDQLAISVFKDPTSSGGGVVRPDGMITLPLLGDVKAVDLTPTQLAEDLTAKFKKFLIDPVVTVTVVGINSKHIFFAGEIKIGEMPYNPSLTPLQAIISDGGPTPYANQKGIYILRTIKGKQVKIPFNYKKAVKTGDQQGVTLLPGDTIVVP